MVMQTLLLGDLWTPEGMQGQWKTGLLAAMMWGFALWVFYFAILEGRWGASIGKALCRIQVARADRTPPGFLKAFLRAVLFLVVPALPMWIYHGFDPVGFFESTSELGSQVATYSYYVIVGLFFLIINCTS